jgi:hypothetical protein
VERQLVLLVEIALHRFGALQAEALVEPGVANVVGVALDLDTRSSCRSSSGRPSSRARADRQVGLAGLNWPWSSLSVTEHELPTPPPSCSFCLHLIHPRVYLVRGLAAASAAPPRVLADLPAASA